MVTRQTRSGELQQRVAAGVEILGLTDILLRDAGHQPQNSGYLRPETRQLGSRHAIRAGAPLAHEAVAGSIVPWVRV